MFLCFPPFSLDVSGFVILTAFLLLCQCDRRRCKAVPIGSVDETVYSALAGRVRVQAETKTISFACVCVLVKSVYLSAFVCLWEAGCLYKSQGKELTKQHSPVTSHSTWILGASVRVAGLDSDWRYFGCVHFFSSLVCVNLCCAVCVIKGGSWANGLACHVYMEVCSLFQAGAG